MKNREFFFFHRLFSGNKTQRVAFAPPFFLFLLFFPFVFVFIKENHHILHAFSVVFLFDARKSRHTRKGSFCKKKLSCKEKALLFEEKGYHVGKRVTKKLSTRKRLSPESDSL